MKEKFDIVIEKFKSKTVLPCIGIYLHEIEPNVYENKIGGKPYIPEGEEYPTNSKGEPLALLLQIDLKDVALLNIPTSGTLEIFCDRNLSKPIEYTIRCYESGLKPREDLPDVDLSNFIVRRAYKIELRRESSYMDNNDYRFVNTFSPIIEEVFGVRLNSLEEYDEYFKDFNWVSEYISSTVSPDIAIGGYPTFIKNDPRSRMSSNYDECIFKLDSIYDGDKIFLGDDGALFALINKDDLKMKNFQKTFVSWDCF